MRFGVREIANVVFKAKTAVKIGTTTFKAGQPVLYIDTAKTSTLEGAATTVYANGGRGNTRLVTWEGEKTLTFTVEDALLSPIGLAVLTGAGLIKGKEAEKVHVHTTTYALVNAETGKINLEDALNPGEVICATAPLFILDTDGDGSLNGGMFFAEKVEPKAITVAQEEAKGRTVLIDYYVTKSSAAVSEIQIDAANFAGYYYVEADTLFRRQSDGVDLPANITIPNVKIQSNFTFSMASTGDPSTFTFTMDAMPGYTYFDKTKKVLCVIQVVEDAEGVATDWTTVMGHTDDEKFDVNNNGNDDNDESGETSADSYPAPWASGLTVTAAEGSAGKTKVTNVEPAAGLGNKFVYTLGAAETKVRQYATIDGTALNQDSDITATENQVITVYEVDSKNRCIKAGSATVVLGA